MSRPSCPNWECVRGLRPFGPPLTWSLFPIEGSPTLKNPMPKIGNSPDVEGREHEVLQWDSSSRTSRDPCDTHIIALCLVLTHSSRRTAPARAFPPHSRYRP